MGLPQFLSRFWSGTTNDQAADRIIDLSQPFSRSDTFSGFLE